MRREVIGKDEWVCEIFIDIGVNMHGLELLAKED